MTLENLKKGQEIKSRIEKLIKEAERLNQSFSSGEVLLSTFGNHSNRETILSNPEAVTRIKSHIRYEVESELSELEKQFNEL